jgi:copper(I)-binding protein
MRIRSPSNDKLIRCGSATAAVILAAALISGCAADDRTGEPEFESGAVSGINARVGQIAMRDVEIQRPPGATEVYPRGGTARMDFIVVNEGSKPDTIEEITSPIASDVQIFADPDGNGTFEPTPDLTLAATAAAPAGAEPVPYYAELLGLTSELRVGMSADVTFRFREAGTLAMTIPVTIPGRR